MKRYVVPFLGCLLVSSLIGCSKDDMPSPRAGIVYKSTGVDDETHKDSSTSQRYDMQQINEKLRTMNNNDLFQFALNCGNEGKYTEALAAYSKIVEKDKNYPEVYYYQGLVYRDLGLIDEAICSFQTAVTQNPNFAEAHYNLGYAYRCKGLHGEAISEYQKALEFISGSRTKQTAAIHYNLGFSLFSQGQIDNAINEFGKALTFKPRDKEIHQKLGIAYTAKGWLDKAKNEFSLGSENDKATNKIP